MVSELYDGPMAASGSGVLLGRHRQGRFLVSWGQSQNQAGAIMSSASTRYQRSANAMQSIAKLMMGFQQLGGEFPPPGRSGRRQGRSFRRRSPHLGQILPEHLQAVQALKGRAPERGIANVHVAGAATRGWYAEQGIERTVPRFHERVPRGRWVDRLFGQEMNPLGGLGDPQMPQMGM